ncbi:hypothetical protein QCA50_018457 [Cerrena zonata]|uniref:Uncharacterized protein n=1 Tax=Cerrena zonata TaxID=2478898 RepID=A0AAW0FB59_9APHY
MSSEKADKTTRPEPTSDINVLHQRLREDPRFNPPTPSVWKRISLIIIVLVLFWVAYSIKLQKPEPKAPVVHANRYSKDYKFRPAASPIITERLKDGRTRVRGAQPTFR